MAKASRLDKAIVGKMSVSYRYMFYGGGGVGKTTLLANAPKPILIDIDDGSAGVDVARYLFRDGDPMGYVPKTYQEVLSAIEDLTESDHEYKTLGIDTIDKFEPLLWKYILERDSQRKTQSNPHGLQLLNIEDYGFGKGYEVAIDEWRNFARLLDTLRTKRGMNIVLLGHSDVRNFKNPTGADYDYYAMRLYKSAAGFLHEWCDVEGFCTHEDITAKIGKREKGIDTGRRLIYFRRTAAFSAKSRIVIPEYVEMDAAKPWAPITAAATQSDLMGLDDIATLIEAELTRLGDEQLNVKVRASVATAKAEQDKSALVRYLNSLSERKPKEEKEGAQ